MIEVQSAIGQTVLNPNFSALNNFSIIGLPIKAANGKCQSSKTLYANFEMSSSCRVYVASAS